jgi:hypothetical protein
MPFTRNGTTPSHLGAGLLIEAIIYACFLIEELGVTRQTLYRHVAPDGTIRPDGQKVLDRATKKGK